MKTIQHHAMLACVLAGVCLLAGCASPAAPAPTVAPPAATVAPPTATALPPTATTMPMLKPGANIGQMVVNPGPAKTDGPPLWAFCSPAFSAEPGVKTQLCTVPPLPELSIGHGWFTADEARRDSNWKAMKWELYLDDQRIDLDAFGAVNVDLPQKGLPGQDPNKEVITKLRTWDVLLSNLTLGAHSLRSVLHVSQQVDDGFHVTQPGTYELVVNMTVAVPPPTQTPAPTPTRILASSAKDIEGVWFGLGTDGLYQRFNQDGTCQTGLAQGSVDVECTWRFEGTRLVMTEVKAIGLPPCSSKTGTYEVQLLANGNIKFVRISDSCAPRARSTAQEHKRIR